MSLPQIADIVVNSPALAPTRDRPDVADENQKADQAAENFGRLDLAFI
jgi:hypothetical protein